MEAAFELRAFLLLKLRNSLVASQLRIQSCHCYGAGSIPGLGTSRCHGYGQKHNKAHAHTTIATASRSLTIEAETPENIDFSTFSNTLLQNDWLISKCPYQYIHSWLQKKKNILSCTFRTFFLKWKMLQLCVCVCVCVCVYIYNLHSK